MKNFLYFLFFMFFINGANAREPLLSNILNENINITASFDGAKITVYGAIDPKLYNNSVIIITILGPPSKLKVSKKKKYFGVWLVSANNTKLLNEIRKFNIGADVVSLGELMRALKAGIKPNKIVFSGVGKTSTEILYAINKKILLINAESKSEILEIERIAKYKKRTVNIGVRLNPNTDAKTLSQISTGKKENKFGVDKKTFLQLVEFIKNSKNLNLKCLSVHIGSQILDHRPYEKMLSVLDKIIKKSNYNFEYIDLGGGMGIDYTNNNKRQFFTKKTKSLKSTQKYFNESKSISLIEIKEFSLLYLILNNFEIFQENIHLIEKIKLFTNENKLVFDAILSKLKNGDKFAVNDLSIDSQLIDKIFKFASIKHILNNYQNNHDKIFDLLEEITRDLKNYELEFRIEELESKFAKDLNESTFNEIRELKKLQNIN